MAAQNVRDQLAIEDEEIAPIVQRMKEGPVRELAAAPAEKRLEVLKKAIADDSDIVDSESTRERMIEQQRRLEG